MICGRQKRLLVQWGGSMSVATTRTNRSNDCFRLRLCGNDFAEVTRKVIWAGGASATGISRRASRARVMPYAFISAIRVCTPSILIARRML
jgi:hypothetical protein